MKRANTSHQPLAFLPSKKKRKKTSISVCSLSLCSLDDPAVSQPTKKINLLLISAVRMPRFVIQYRVRKVRLMRRHFVGVHLFHRSRPGIPDIVRDGRPGVRGFAVDAPRVPAVKGTQLIVLVFLAQISYLTDTRRNQSPASLPPFRVGGGIERRITSTVRSHLLMQKSRRVREPPWT